MEKIERIDPFIKMKYDEKTNTYVEADPAVNNFGGVIPPIYREPMPYVTTSRAFNPYPEEKIPHWANKENIYVTNNAVSREVIEMFLKEIHECAYSLKEDILSGKLDCFIRVIAIIIADSRNVSICAEKYPIEF